MEQVYTPEFIERMSREAYRVGIPRDPLNEIDLMFSPMTCKTNLSRTVSEYLSEREVERGNASDDRVKALEEVR